MSNTWHHAMWAQETFGGKTMVWGHNIHIAKGIIDDESYPYAVFEGTFRQ